MTFRNIWKCQDKEPCEVVYLQLNKCTYYWLQTCLIKLSFHWPL